MKALLKLYTYYRSSASYRVRIALHLKGIAFEPHFVHLTRGGGEHLSPTYKAVNPQARLPALSLPDGDVVIQSPAILEWLEETYPLPPLLPEDPLERARVRGVAALIACDIHPLNNSGPLGYLRRTLNHSDAEVSSWISHWITQGFSAVEALISDDGWAFGPEPGLADLYIVPQVFSARRFLVRLDAFPRIRRIEALSATHPAFAKAAPGAQPDAE